MNERATNEARAGGLFQHWARGQTASQARPGGALRPDLPYSFEAAHDPELEVGAAGDEPAIDFHVDLPQQVPAAQPVETHDAVDRPAAKLQGADAPQGSATSFAPLSERSEPEARSSSAESGESKSRHTVRPSSRDDTPPAKRSELTERILHQEITRVPVAEPLPVAPTSRISAASVKSVRPMLPRTPQSQPMPLLLQSAAAPEPIIEIHIGRIEVRAQPARQATPAPSRAPDVPDRRLESYLRRRTDGARS